MDFQWRFQGRPLVHWIPPTGSTSYILIKTIIQYLGYGWCCDI